MPSEGQIRLENQGCPPYAALNRPVTQSHAPTKVIEEKTQNKGHDSC